MKKYSKTFLILAIISKLAFTGWATVRIIKSVQFEFGCSAFLKRAANANTVELAITELGKAIEYVEDNNLTEGTVSIFLQNPANDIGFWYRNMTSAYDELNALPEDASPLERTNVLMKLRESLTDSDSNGSTTVIIPDGISIYPNNMIFFIWSTLSIIAMCVFWTLFGVSIGLKFETVTENKKIVLRKN